MEEVKKESSSSEKNGETAPSRRSGLKAVQKHSGWCSYETKLKAVSEE